MASRTRVSPDARPPRSRILWPDEAAQWEPLIPLVRERRLVLDARRVRRREPARARRTGSRCVVDGVIALPPSSRGAAAGRLPAGLRPVGHPRRRGGGREPQAAGRAAVPRHDLRAAERAGLDARCVPPVEARAASGSRSARTTPPRRRCCAARVRAGRPCRRRAPAAARRLRAAVLQRAARAGPRPRRPSLARTTRPASRRRSRRTSGRPSGDGSRTGSASSSTDGRDRGRAAAWAPVGRVGQGLAALRGGARSLPDGRGPPARRSAEASRRRRVGLFDGPLGAWPQDNEHDEKELRSRPRRGCDARCGGCRATACRRSSASTRSDAGGSGPRSGEAPLAFALEHLAVLAAVTPARAAGRLACPSSSTRTPTDGWQADDAVMRALAAVGDRSRSRCRGRGHPDAVRAVARRGRAPVPGGRRRDGGRLRSSSRSSTGRPAPASSSSTASATTSGERVEAALLAAGAWTSQFEPRWPPCRRSRSTAKPAVSPVIGRSARAGPRARARSHGGADLAISGLRSLLPGRRVPGARRWRHRRPGRPGMDRAG